MTKKTDAGIEEILEEEQNVVYELVDFPKRPVPKNLYMEVRSSAITSGGQAQNEQQLSFDGYTLSWKAVAYPHIPSLKSYAVTIERDGLIFFDREFKIFGYEKKKEQIIEAVQESYDKDPEQERRLAPEKVFIESKSVFPERNGRQPAEICLRFDGYKSTWRPSAFPHRPSVKSYELTIDRDGQVFFHVEHRLFSR